MLIPIIVCGAIVTAVLVVLAAGSMLPESHQASVNRRLAASPEAVWAALTDLEGQVHWRKDLQSIKVLGQDPVRWVETMKMGEVPMRIDRTEAPALLVTRIDSDDLPFGGTWTFNVAPDGQGSNVTITEDGFVKPPLFRFLSKYVFGHDKTLNGFADSLVSKFGEAVG
ncbi:MAG: SRPBCC family protein [Armatimonadetes bacterium]|nr:SRPBCC family protein [Armatimonadota bacterium]